MSVDNITHLVHHTQHVQILDILAAVAWHATLLTVLLCSSFWLITFFWYMKLRCFGRTQTCDRANIVIGRVSGKWNLTDCTISSFSTTQKSSSSYATTCAADDEETCEEVSGGESRGYSWLQRTAKKPASRGVTVQDMKLRERENENNNILPCSTDGSS